MTSQLLIKLLLISGITTAVFFALRSNSTTNLALRRLGGLAFAGVAAISILFPGIVQAIADIVGVARGTDLVLYALVVVFLFVSIALYQRVHLLEMRLTQVARALALAERNHEQEPADKAS